MLKRSEQGCPDTAALMSGMYIQSVNIPVNIQIPEARPLGVDLRDPSG